MNLKILLIFVALGCCECIPFSSFWAPLFNPKILGYRVDVPFNPDAGRNGRDDFQNNYGYRGEKLIDDLGNGNGPPKQNKNIEEVKFYYTYDGAKNDNLNSHNK